MAIPINIEDLLNKRKIESNRIEFKSGWNPQSIYHSICAFANDIDNLGGGYILVGVEEENGMAKRPVKGIPIEQLDQIQREMIGFNNMMEPYYFPRISVEDVDGKSILAIWAPSGTERPYTAPENVTAKLKKPVFYVRYGTSSIEAKDELLDQLREMSAKVPFDDRGNENIHLEDISMVQFHPDFTGETIGLKNELKDLKDPLKDLKDPLKDAYRVIRDYPYDTVAQLAERLGIGKRAMKYRTDYLKARGYIERKGKRKGYWIILK